MPAPNIGGEVRRRPQITQNWVLDRRKSTPEGQIPKVKRIIEKPPLHLHKDYSS